MILRPIGGPSTTGGGNASFAKIRPGFHEVAQPHVHVDLGAALAKVLVPDGPGGE